MVENQEQSAAEIAARNFITEFTHYIPPKVRRILQDYKNEVLKSFSFSKLKIRYFFLVSKDEKMLIIFTNFPGHWIGFHGNRIFKYQEQLKKETGVEKIHLIEIL